MPKAKPFSDEDEKTTIEADTQWADEPSTTVEQGDVKNALITGVTGVSIDEHTVDDGNQPGRAPARLVITAGNDTGIAQDLLVGKSYTIGRGLDNDLVLTDIAVSRKHFDLRNDDGAWVIVDRGSGNGTVVNGNLEDNPFMLANGDVIEIGTTTFRFDFLSAAMPRDLPAQSMNGFGSDDDEMSTVAGKPLNAAKTMDSVDVHLDTPSRMQPMPRPQTLPPPMARPRTISNQGYPQPQGTPGPQPATTLPMPQMSNRNPIGSSQSPTLLAAEPLRQVQVVSTIPGQGMQSPQHNAHHNGMMPAQAMYGNGSGYPQQGGYPQASEIPPHSVHAQMLVAAQMNKRGDHSTAHVQPIAFSSMVAQPEPVTQAPLTRRAKMALIFGGIAAATLFITIAVVKSGGPATKTAAATKGSAAVVVVPLPKPTVSPIVPEAMTKPVTPTPVTPTPVAPKPEPKVIAQVPKPEPKPEPKVIAPKPAPKPPVVVARPKPLPKVERQADPPKQDIPKPDKPEKRVATAEALSERAETLYKDRKFNDAMNLLSSAAKSASGDEASELRSKAAKISQFAKAFNSGMAPGGKALDSYTSLQLASVYDQQLGGAFQADITAKLQAVIGKAAVALVSAKSFDKAHQAVMKADAIGSGGDNNIKAVRDNLEATAKALYGDAMAELSSNPSSAKDKLKQVKAMVDSKSPTFQKASKALAGS